DRHDCSGRSWIRTLHGRAYSVGVREQLHYCADPVWWIRVIAFDGTARWPGAHWISDIHEHAWLGSWQAYPKCFHDRKDWRAVRANRARNHNRVEVWCRRGKLQGDLK